MRNIGLIVVRELSSYLRTPSGYLIAAAVLFLEALFFNAFAINAPEGTPRMSGDVLAMFFYVAAIMTIAAGAMFSVRLLAEDRASGTDVLFAKSPFLRENSFDKCRTSSSGISARPRAGLVDRRPGSRGSTGRCVEVR